MASTTTRRSAWHPKHRCSSGVAPRFELRVADRFHDRVALDYGRSGPSLRTTFGPCPSETEWLLFTGYVWVADPECITLEVVLPDSTVEARELGLGAPCPGEL